MSVVEKFKKQLGRVPHKETGDTLEYRGIQELDKVIYQATTILRGMKVVYSMRKTPILKGFIIRIPQPIGD